MEAPKEIFVHIRKEPRPSITFSEIEEKNCENIKYIRSDIAELTWVDMLNIVTLANKVYDEFDTDSTFGEIYNEVLRRFNEQRNK